MVGVVLTITGDLINMREGIVLVSRRTGLTVEAVDHQDSQALFKVNVVAFL